ncbi:MULTISPECIES: paraquat-inducible protein A [Thiorhodovibrio]|uniref:paraquat-inducible protein A n=1 Tax=Thiorhodovibrio TaxID=61593 RepID=UPI001912E6A4|nr:MULTISPECIES: paraquat-inducible protein A [Thiorhodovibrio]MBK5967576.1 paraquat-inducible membrane protein A [Thiorhodovibrio winogradskyi]WPL14926.1 Inner membrane protein YebS [Thiorhodovibrio litoralis]
MQTLACPDCDLLQSVPDLPPGGKASCARCGHALATGTAGPIGRPLALTIAALFLLIIANIDPLMDLSAVGRHASTTIIGGAYQMWLEGQQATAVVVGFCAVVAPAGYILFMLVVLLGAGRTPVPRWVGEMLRWADRMRPWSMVEVMMLGILVALIKIADLAKVEPGIGMAAVGVLMLLIPAIEVNFDPHAIWHRVTWVEPKSSPPIADDSAPGTSS